MTSTESAHDLDNIRLTSSIQYIESTFVLQNILLEAYSKEEGNIKDGRRVPAGLGFTLGTEIHPLLYDTITMVILGFPQLTIRKILVMFN